MKVWISGARITITWRGGKGVQQRTFKIESTEQISDVKVKVDYELRGEHLVAVPVELDDRAAAAIFDQVLGKVDA